MMDINADLLQEFIIFDKNSSNCTIEGATMQNQQLPEELHKSTIRNFYKRKVYSSFKTTFGC